MTKLRTYRVGFWIEQGYAIMVEARSRHQAEQLVRKRLDDAIDRLNHSDRVHHDHGVFAVDLVRTRSRHG